MDHFQRSLQKTLLNLPHNFEYIRRQGGGAGAVAFVELVGEQLVFPNVILRHPQRRQNERCGQARSVFACCAVKQQGLGRGQ